MKFVFATVLATAVTTAAMASGPVVPYDPPVVPVVPVAYNWTGGYAGFGVGYANGNNASPTGILADPSGAMFSVIAGYNWHNGGNMVWGVEGAISGGSIDASTPCSNPTWTCSSSIDYIATIRGRVGIAQDRSMFFMTLGPALASVENVTTNAANVSFPDTNRVAGLTIGIGFETALRSQWNLRGDLEYYRFRDSTYNLDVPYVNNRTTASTARVSLVRRF